ncbi:hypothetical protein TRFO_33252 [Tritrichomonas foetus]|uniref:Importin N-terminal domain-containing protein n=1 Tax=Tritrichomonas foetus TaxID=1144522 RepID=A0A1J4JP27_9EUKA|nr:hypothetical protein TRFO_33252 [Tritrichomonas foetus]|eukprot:OHT00168.1 hypothetical protein TRFO_33252 [Tritrichomonas foetus]
MSNLLCLPAIFPSLLNIYISEFSDQNVRQHIAVFFSQSIKKIWHIIDFQTRISVFNILTDILIKEPIWQIRNLLIYSVQLIMTTGELYGPLFEFITKSAENGSDDYLIIALTLAPVFSNINRNDPSNNMNINNPNFEGNEQILSFLISLLERGFSSGNIEVKINALHLLMYASSKLVTFPPFHERFPHFWEVSLSLFDISLDELILHRVSNYFIFAFKQSAYSEMIHPISLLEKSVSFLSVQNLSPQIIFCIFYLIENICNTYPQFVLQCGVFPQLVQMSLTASSALYHPEDSILISEANFFENIFSSLCKTPDVLAAVWQILVQVTTTEHGRFFACCVLYVILPNFPSFFIDKLNDISELLCNSLSENSRLLVDAAARTTTCFIGLYGREIDFSTEIIKVVLEACKKFLTSDLLLVFTSLLDLTKDSEDIFDQSFPFLLSIITTGPIDVRSAALSAMASLSCGSTIKINYHFLALFNLIIELLQCQNEFFNQLRPLAVECLSRATTVVDETFDPSILSFCECCVNNLKNPDLDFSLSCFNALELILQHHPKAFQPLIEPLLPILCEFSAFDSNKQFKSSTVDSIDRMINDENFVDDEIDDFNSPQVAISAISLRVLSFITKINPELCHRFEYHIIQCCEIQKDIEDSLNLGKIATCVAIGNLAEAIIHANNGAPSLSTSISTSIPPKMGHILLSILSPLDENNHETSLIMACFTAAMKVVEWHDYEALSNCLKPLLDTALETFVRLGEMPSYDAGILDMVEAMYGFINMVALSAEDRAPQLLSGFITLFTNFTTHPDLRLRSYSARFFADLLSSSSENIDSQFLSNIMSFAANFADQEGDQFAFTCLRNLAINVPEAARQISSDVYRICMNKLALPFSNSVKAFLMRDSAISTIASYVMNIIQAEFIIDENLPIILNALPLVLDYTENDNVMTFFLWLFNKSQGQNIELFLRVLVVLFSNPPVILSKLQISDQLKGSLLNLLVSIISQISNPNEIIGQILENDEQKGNILQEYLNAFKKQQEPNE